MRDVRDIWTSLHKTEIPSVRESRVINKYLCTIALDGVLGGDSVEAHFRDGARAPYALAVLPFLGFPHLLHPKRVC